MTELLPRVEIAPAVAPTGGRVASLDGLRGMAAAAVVAFHVSMFFPAMAAPHVVGARLDERHALAWWLTHTPLKVLTMGPESVVVFFVLSGYVLTRSIPGRSVDWAGFWLRRVVRLGLPWVGAVVGAAVLIALVPRHLTASDSQAVAESAVSSLSPSVVLSALNPVGTNYALDTPLWSLRWELTFSLLLPLYVLVGRRLRQLWFPGLLLVVATVTLGQAELFRPAAFLPAFLVGVVLACSTERVAAIVIRLDGSRHRELAWTALLAGGLGVFWSGWCLGILPRDHSWARCVWVGLWPMAAGALLVAALGRSWIRRSLESTPAQWLGRVSFSLYLVHVPVLMTVWFAARSLPVAPRLILGLVLTVGAAVAFERYVERPAHRLSRRVGAPVRLRTAA